MHNNNKEWQGPISLELDFYSEHSKTIRYRGRLESKPFDYYVPKDVLPVSNEEHPLPEKISVAIMASDLPKNEIGFMGKRILPRAGNDFWEYDFFEDKVNSFRYDMSYESQKYSLYMPREIFSIFTPPNRILVYIFIDS